MRVIATQGYRPTPSGCVTVKVKRCKKGAQTSSTWITAVTSLITTLLAFMGVLLVVQNASESAEPLSSEGTAAARMGCCGGVDLVQNASELVLNSSLAGPMLGK